MFGPLATPFASIRCHSLDRRLCPRQFTAIARSPSPCPIQLLFMTRPTSSKTKARSTSLSAKLQEALTADPNYALAHSALAVVLQKLGKHEEAIQHAQEACELEPNDPFSFTALSVTYQRAFAGTNNMQYIRMAEDAMEQSRILQSRH